MNDQLTNAEADRIVKEARFRMLSTQAPDLIQVASIDPTLQLLRTQQVQLRVEYAGLSAKFGEGYPRVAELQHQMSDIDNSIRQELVNLGQRVQNEYETATKTEQLLRKSMSSRKKMRSSWTQV